MKKELVLFFLLLMPRPAESSLKLAGAGAGITLGLYMAYRWFRKPSNYIPTIENMNTVTIREVSYEPVKNDPISIDQLVQTIYENGVNFEKKVVAHEKSFFEIQRGIAINENDPTVCVFSRGYAKVKSMDEFPSRDFYDLTQLGGGARGALIQCIDHIAPHAPIIGFDYRDDRRNFSMGAHKELKSLTVIMESIKQKNENARIILIADCRGAGVALRYAAQNDPSLKALVLMSPFVSGRDLSDQIAQNYLARLPFNKTILHTFFRTYYPCYHPKDHDVIHEKLKKIPADLPIFITHRQKDSLISPESLERLRESLMHNTKLEFFMVDDESAPHSKLTHLKEVQTKIQQFYQTHQLVPDSAKYENNFLANSVVTFAEPTIRKSVP